MKNIGILTFINPANKSYGAILQAFALFKTLQSMDFEIEFLDLRTTKVEIPPIAKLKQYVRGFMEGNPFRSFLIRNTSISKPLSNYDALAQYIRKYDVVIVGSDQVWRPEYCGELALNFFLDFVPDNIPRIAYAASFGKDMWSSNPELTDKIKREIQKFVSVSVRETSGITICKEVFGIDAELVLDPTLMLDKADFDALLPKRKGKVSYLASFILDRSVNTVEIESYISEQTGYKIQNLNKKVMSFLGVKWTKHLSVINWLLKIRDAEFVITDSFHCVCFALIFHRKFVCIGNQNRGLARFQSLLSLVGLDDRIYLSLAEVKEKNNWNEAILYEQISGFLSKFKTQSFDFLNNALLKKQE